MLFLDCKEPPAVIKGLYSDSLRENYHEGDTVDFYCEPGLLPNPAGYSIECGRDGWLATATCGEGINLGFFNH